MSSSADYSIAADPDGVIMMSQRGFWTSEIALKFIAEAETVISAAQTRGTLRLMIDVRQFKVAGADVGEKLAEFDMRIRRTGDRVAIVVESSLLKMQMKRQLSRPGLEVFISESAALTWVRA